MRPLLIGLVLAAIGCAENVEVEPEAPPETRPVDCVPACDGTHQVCVEDACVEVTRLRFVAGLDKGATTLTAYRWGLYSGGDRFSGPVAASAGACDAIGPAMWLEPDEGFYGIADVNIGDVTVRVNDDEPLDMVKYGDLSWSSGPSYVPGDIVTVSASGGPDGPAFSYAVQIPGPVSAEPKSPFAVGEPYPLGINAGLPLAKTYSAALFDFTAANEGFYAVCELPPEDVSQGATVDAEVTGALSSGTSLYTVTAANRQEHVVDSHPQVWISILAFSDWYAQ